MPWLRALCLSILLCSRAAAQPAPQAGAPPGEENEPAWAGATLPESNEAVLLASRVYEAVEQRDFRLAIELIHQIQQLQGDLVAAPASRTYYPVWRHAMRLMLNLPREAVDMYQQLHDAEVAAGLEEAARKNQVDELRRLFRRHAISSHWTAVGSELVAQLLDRGEFGEALEVLRELPDGAERPAHGLQLAAALAGLEAWRAAERCVEELRTRSAFAEGEWRDRLERVAAYVNRAPWLADRALEPLTDTPTLWSRPLIEGDSAARIDDHELQSAVDSARSLPLHRVVVEHGVILTRLAGAIRAFDAATLIPVWAEQETTARSDAAPGMMRFERSRTGETGLSEAVENLLFFPLAFSLSAGNGLVFSVEGLPRSLREATTAAFHGQVSTPAGNLLVARRVADGRVAWECGADPRHPLYGVAFQDSPLVVGDRLLVIVQRAQALELCALRAADGQLVASVPLVGPPTHLPIEGGRCFLVADETTLFAVTGNGVVAALRLHDLGWLWATKYPTLANVTSEFPWQMEELLEAPIDPPHIAEEFLIVAPVDSPNIHALDRVTGRERWRVPRGRRSFIVDAWGGGLIVGSNRLTSLDLTDGVTVRWHTVPLDVVGRPELQGDRIFVPTAQGLVTVSAANGKVIDDASVKRSLPHPLEGPGAASSESSLDTPDAPAGTDDFHAALRSVCIGARLATTHSALVALTPNRITKFPDPSIEPHEGLRADRDGVATAWARLLSGRAGEALEILEALKTEDAAVERARLDALREALVLLAAESSSLAVGNLERAQQLSGDPRERARITLRIAEACERTGQWETAAKQYLSLILSEPATLIEFPGGREAAWLRAAERLERCIEASPQADVLLTDALKDALRRPGASVFFDRILLALGPGPRREMARQALLLSQPAPELAAAHLPDRDALRVAGPLGRRVLLERWEVNTALGRIEEALADEAAWQATSPAHAASEPGDGLLTAAPLEADQLARRVARIETALRKLEAAAGPTFDQRLARLWSIQDAELVAPDGPDGGQGWTLIRKLDERALQLIYAYKYEFPLRSTRDGLGDARSAEFDITDGIWHGTRLSGQIPGQAFWPALGRGALRAVPVDGGWVALGMGPERHGGRRLWELPAPEITPALGAPAAAGPYGIYFVTRARRLVHAGWNDGSIRWERDWSADVERLECNAGRLLLLDAEHKLSVLDQTRGVVCETPPMGAVVNFQICGDVAVLRLDGAMAGLDLQSLKFRWLRPGGPIDAQHVVIGRPWILQRPALQTGWEIVDVSTGQVLTSAPLEIAGHVTAAVADDHGLLLAAMMGDPETGVTVEVQLAHFSSTDWKPRWTREFRTGAPVNASQLAGHPEFIPLLLLDATSAAAGDLSAAELTLVHREDGASDAPESIGRFFEHRASPACRPYLHVTRTAIIAQGNGRLVCFGVSPLGRR